MCEELNANVCVCVCVSDRSILSLPLLAYPFKHESFCLLNCTSHCPLLNVVFAKNVLQHVCAQLVVPLYSFCSRLLRLAFFLLSYYCLTSMQWRAECIYGSVLTVSC